ncbi:MAG: serine hydrolase [Actinomycetota bacterium]|nr:serine hydrolase [Actinomycetota bacterium]
MRCAWGLRWRLLVAAMVVVAWAVALGATPARAAPAAPVTTAPAPPPPPKAWILVDGDTGKVIDAGNSRAPLPPASLTKVITALTASNLRADTPVTVSDRAAAAPADKLMLKSGQVWTADEMLRALLLSSANDAAIALAERVGGTVEGFQPIFARTALGLGMADSPLLMDPSGLDGPDGVDGGNLVSARDLAIAGRALLAVPSLAGIVATPVYYFDGPDKVHHRLTNHNKLFLTTYTGGIGIKTGYTKRAGGCVMAAAQVGGRTMLAVVLASANPTAAAKLLLDKGFATPVSAETPIDQLPAVNLAALDPAASAPSASAVPAGPGSPTAPAPTLASPTAPSPVPSPVPAAPAATGSPPLSWLLAAVSALALVLGGIGLRRRQLRRRRRQRRRGAPNLWAERDRRAA